MSSKITLIVLIGLLAVSILPAATQSSSAQTSDAVCSALTTQALGALEANCAELARDTACYGFDLVEASFFGAGLDASFSQPGDRVGLIDLQELHAFPLDLETGHWGLAMLNVGADLPGAAADSAVRYLLVGDGVLQNMVPPAEAVQGAAPLSVVTLVGSNLRSTPDLNGQVVGSVPAGTELLVDAVSQDGGWLRTFYEGQAAWVSRQLLQTGEDLDSLPVFNSESLSPIQALCFSGNEQEPACDGALPSMLFIQSPGDAVVHLMINGTELRLKGTVVLRNLPDGRLQLIVLSGSAWLGQLTLPAGFIVDAPLSGDGCQVDGNWAGFHPLGDEERGLLGLLEDLSPDVLNEVVEIPTNRQIQQTLIRPGGVGLGADVGQLISGNVDCGPLHLTSPLDGIPYGDATFYWDGIPEATNYRLNIYNERNERVGSYQTGSPTTNLTLNVTSSQIGAGFIFSWNVEAWVGNQRVCATPAVTISRESPTGAVPVGGGPAPVPTRTPGPYG